MQGDPLMRKITTVHDLKWMHDFVACHVRFYLKIRKFPDNGRVSANIVNLIYKIDRGWFSDAKHCVEHGLKWFRSKVMCLWSLHCHFNHCEYIPGTLRYDAKTHINSRNGAISGSVPSVRCRRVTFSVQTESGCDVVSHNTCCVGN